MSILYIITQADGGGAQNYVLTLAKYFSGTIAAGGESKQLFADAEFQRIPTVKLRYLKRAIHPIYDVLAMLELRRLIETQKPDIVHLNSTKAGILGSFACVGLKTKVVFTAHGFVFNEPLGFALKNFYLSLEKIASGYRDKIITVSWADEASALANNIISKDKIITIHNGIDQVEFLDKQQAREALRLSTHKIVFGSTSNFYKTKGLDILLKAVALMSADIKSKIQVVLIGDGPETKNLELEIKNLQLENTVKLSGKIGNVAQYLKAFDCFVLPSRKEGLPFGLLEAMQAGVPIVASKTGGVSEALGDSGFLVKPGDAGELSQVLTKIILDLNAHGPNYFSAFSAVEKKRALNFNKDMMLVQTQKVYTKLIN